MSFDNNITDIISDKDIKQYQERGFWISPKIVNDNQISKLRSAFEKIFRGDYDAEHYGNLPANDYDFNSSDIRQYINGWWVNNTIRNIMYTPVIGYIGARLMQSSETRVWHDQILWKPGAENEGENFSGGNVGWHQDYAHWQCSNTSNMCSVWIALQDMKMSNGPMRFVVGSNNWGLREDAYTFGEKDLDNLKEKYTELGKPWIEEPVLLKAGEASFHHALTFHGSSQNMSSKPRLSYIVHMMPKGCGLKSGWNQFHGNSTFLGPNAKEGSIYEGEFFPRLWPVEQR
tara:strand:+ start:941 stop:1801 length:861 start_codon:yes stop_codon:yes gene_type:complete